MAQSEADRSVLSRRVSHGRPLLPLGDGQMRRPQGPEQRLSHNAGNQGKGQQDKAYSSPQRNTIFPGHPEPSVRHTSQRT